MGKEKINQQDLINLLAEHGAFATKTEAARFLNALQEVFQKTLLTEKVVKLNGVGTFRLQWVEPRRSVDVRTGEAINIAGHDKLAFVADAALKDALGTPADTEKEPKEKPLQKLTEQANEIKDILSEINDVESVAPTDGNDHQQQPSDSTPDTTKSVIASEIPSITDSPNEPAQTPTDEQQALIKAIVDNAVRTPQPKKKSHAWVWILVTILLLLGAGIASSFYFYGDIIRTWCEGRWTDVREWVDDCIERFAPDEQPAPTEIIDPQAVQPDTVSALPFDSMRVYDHIVATERIVKGIHLAQLARKYYSNTEFWVYIYEANKCIMATPDALEVGMLIRIPALDARLVDATDTAAITYAHRLGQAYISGE
ncbi:MAG: HU family DNA-binding protein [Paludibacteraceae bacterium]